MLTSSSKIDVLIWAHSDQPGGTEIPCVLASALRRRTGRGISCAIWTPFPTVVVDFFKLEGGLKRQIPILTDSPMLLLEKNPRTGAVDGMETIKHIQKLSKTSVEEVVSKWKRKLEERLHTRSLFISCGEPVALKVAQECKRKSIIVTDHLLTQSVKHVLNSAGNAVSQNIWTYMTMLESFDTMAETAFLSPPEFGMPAYRSYLSELGHTCMEIGGLFYDPVPTHELECAPHYEELMEVNRKFPLAVVFGGGGPVWNGIYCKIHDAVKGGLLKDFSVIVRDVSGQEVIPRTWRLFTPDDQRGQPLRDPGRMMYWYAACTLLVGRGGLAAQQILATMLSDAPSAPGMLFVEEPGHPQIESERRTLKSLGLVHSYDLANFSANPFDLIRDNILNCDESQVMRDRARLRYAPGMIDRLADYILSTYQPHKRTLPSRERADIHRPYAYSLTFWEEVEDLLELPETLGGKTPPLQLEIHPPPDDLDKSCWLKCPHCYGYGLGRQDPPADVSAFEKVVRDFKGKVGRIVISGLYSDPLCSTVTPKLLRVARDGVPQHVGLHTKLLGLNDTFFSALVEGCREGDYLTVSLDAGTAKVLGRVTGNPDQADQHLKEIWNNLRRVQERRATKDGSALRMNITYLLLSDDNVRVEEINAVIALAKEVEADAIRFSIPQPPLLQPAEGTSGPSVEALDTAIRHLRSWRDQTSRPQVLFKEYRDWTRAGFRRCYAQIFHPALGADGYFYPCCQTAAKEFAPLRILQAASDPKNDNWRQWYESHKRLGLLSWLVDGGGCAEASCMNCRVCNRKDGSVNSLIAGVLMGSE